MLFNKPKKVTLRRIHREQGADGRPYYVQTEEIIERSRLPKKARHVTGDSQAFCVVDMDPDYPDYAEPYVDQETGEARGNFVDAIGYHLYFVDTRMRDGFDELGRMKKKGATIDPKHLLIIGVVAVVCIWMAVRLLRCRQRTGRRRSSFGSLSRS